MKCLKRGVTLFVFAKWTTLHDERGAQDNEQGLKGTPIHFRENKKYCRWRFLLILNLPFIYHFKNSVLLRTKFCWEFKVAENSIYWEFTLLRTQFCWEVNFTQNSIMLWTQFCYFSEIIGNMVYKFVVNNILGRVEFAKCQLFKVNVRQNLLFEQKLEFWISVQSHLLLSPLPQCLQITQKS